MVSATKCQEIFTQCIEDYHVHDSVGQPLVNPFASDTIEHLLYEKCWVDTVQWHFEDLIRNPEIDPVEGMALKRLIDGSNQRRTDLVEQIDDYFLEEFAHIEHEVGARVNSESPAWVVDRLSILALKLYHMAEQLARTDTNEAHKAKIAAKLTILSEQQSDLSTSFDELLADISQGKRLMKVYRQMKLYNDPATNPVLYKGPK